MPLFNPLFYYKLKLTIYPTARLHETLLRPRAALPARRLGAQSAPAGTRHEGGLRYPSIAISQAPVPVLRPVVLRVLIYFLWILLLFFTSFLECECSLCDKRLSMAFWALKLGVQLLNSGCSGEGDEKDERDEECVWMTR